MSDLEKSNVNVENGLANTTASPTTVVKESKNHGTPKHYKKSSADENTAGSSGTILLPARVLDKLYHNYSIKQRRSGLKWFLFAALLFISWSVIIPMEQCLFLRVVNICMLISYIGFVGLLHVGRNANNTFLQRIHQHLLILTPNILWSACIVHLVFYMQVMHQEHTFSTRDVLGWMLLLNFLIYVTLPVPLVYVLIIGFWTYTICVGAPIIFARNEPQFYASDVANAVLIAAAALIGLGYYFMGEAKQKRAFLEAKKSLEVKMVIEEQSAEQERLLLSVLPKHVAVKMREDLGSSSSEPFKKIYMSRHENVSILYADIVGFTAISSTYSAQDLVKMLNELFARFDRLAEKYQQLRIKILGDCYYCISGAPDERPDHAVLCVHMGLSMVKAIKYVQQKANSPVDMRVGIHTGAVLAGILGQRQWQFDVYSKDVELANKMESSGKAGRVHISDKTLAFLNGEFEVEPAHGERREELLRIAGLKTYFITKVVKPFSSPCAKKLSESIDTTVNTEQQQNDENDALDELLTEANNSTAKQTPEQLKASAAGDKKAKQENFKQRLEDELVTRNGHENLHKDTTCFLKFKNKSLESAYASYREPYSSLPLLASLMVQLIAVIYSVFVLPRNLTQLLRICLPLLPLGVLVFISIAESFPSYLPELCIAISQLFNDNTFMRELSAIIITLAIGLSNIYDMWAYALAYDSTLDTALDLYDNSNTNYNNNSNNSSNVSSMAAIPAAAAFVDSAMSVNEVFVMPYDSTGHMLYPSYLSNFAILVLIAIAVIAQLTHVTKIMLMLLVAALHCIFNIFVLADLYAYEDQLANNPTISIRFCTSGLLLVAALALCFLTRHMDHEDRVIFKWKNEVAEQKETANDMRQRNEALVYNVLPVHVAEHFMKNTKRSHDDLYSQSYAEVGVLFASMPNFSDFYSEESVNNQGLECLRFLNEVISDFDALLELPQFQDIIKIKTIGSTYMAASGINVQRELSNDAPITKRWSHLAVLVEFALELKKALQGINEQSFNHFVLKMGINHGPITAGVIGARKPHYDIWGNTVNVASRMESTGKAGAIQVTEETCNILQEFGYTFLQRGLVAVKGKGQLMTYYLQGKTNGKTVARLLKAETPETDVNPQNMENMNSLTIDGRPEQQELETDIKTPLIKLQIKNDSATAVVKEQMEVHLNSEKQSLLD